MADLSTVVTSFPADQASLALVQANTPLVNSYGTVTVTGGQLNVLCDTTYNHGGQSALNFTWSGAGFYFKPTPAPKGGASTSQTTTPAIIDSSSSDGGSIRLEWVINTGPATPTITAYAYSVDGTYTDVSTAVSATYSSTTHAWLGWYGDATNIYYVTSSTGTTWTTFRTVARTLIPWVATEADLGFVYSTNRVGGSNTTALLDNINTGGTAPGAAAAGVRGTQPLVNYGLPATQPMSAVRRASSW